MAQPKKSAATKASKPSKTNSKSNTKAKAKKGKGKRQPTPRFSLSNALPGKVREIESVKAFATKVDSAEALLELNQAIETLQERTVELYESFQGRADALEESAREAFEEQLEEVRTRAATLRDKAQDTRAGRLLNGLPSRATVELDEILARLGLMRVAAHEDALETLRTRYKGLMKAAATKARNQAMKDAKKKFVAKAAVKPDAASTDA